MSDRTLILACLTLLTGACSIFQGNDTATSVPVTPVEQGKLAPLPPIAPASRPQAVSSGQNAPAAAPSPGSTGTSVPVPAVVQPASPQPAAIQPAPAQPAAGQVSGRLPPLPPPRAPGSLAGAAVSDTNSSSTATLFTPQTPRFLSGDWQVSEPGRAATCRLILSSAGAAGVLDATTEGCSSTELSRTVAWQSRGEDLVLLDQRASPIVLFRRAGNNRFEGLGLVGDTFILSR